MRTKKQGKQSKAPKRSKLVIKATLVPTESAVPEPEAFLEEAKKERRRKLILDHTGTIRVLRNEKKFTFGGIADWFNERGFQTDRSAVYRAYLLSIPNEQIDPNDTELREMEPD